MTNVEQPLPRAYDLIVYGASGFTGRLVAEHLLGTYGAIAEIRWAMAGRSDGRSVSVSVKGDKDPGYGSTSKMIAESGICLARDVSHDAVGGGFWTTASALGELLISRLQAKAGLTFMLQSG
jgi:short subunit dehydrogenase-like uncharacterized protein